MNPSQAAIPIYNWKITFYVFYLLNEIMKMIVIAKNVIFYVSRGNELHHLIITQSVHFNLHSIAINHSLLCCSNTLLFGCRIHIYYALIR